MRKIEINKMLLGLVLAFFSCISHADENRYWDDLDENSKSEIINTIDVDKKMIIRNIPKYIIFAIEKIIVK